MGIKSELEFELTKEEIYDGCYRFYLTVIRDGKIVATDWFTIENGKVDNDLIPDLELLLSYSFYDASSTMVDEYYIRLIELFGYTI